MKRIFSSKKPRAATEPLPKTDVTQLNIIRSDYPQQGGMSDAQLHCAAVLAVVDPALCAQQHTQVRLRESLLSHVCDAFDIKSVAEDKVWMRADPEQCVAQNCRMLIAPAGTPLATFSEVGSRMTAAIKVEGPGYQFIVRVCCYLVDKSTASAVSLEHGLKENSIAATL